MTRGPLPSYFTVSPEVWTDIDGLAQRDRDDTAKLLDHLKTEGAPHGPGVWICDRLSLPEDRTGEIVSLEVRVNRCYSALVAIRRTPRDSEVYVLRVLPRGAWAQPSESHSRGLTARRTTSLAVRVAGSRRSHLQTEWAAILAGSPEDGLTFSPCRQVVLALGFLVAAVRMRLHDAVRPMWRPVDWMLGTASRTNGLIATGVGAQAIYIVGDGGLPALVTEVWEPCGIAGAALYALSRWLRGVRGIESATTEREPADE